MSSGFGHPDGHPSGAKVRVLIVDHSELVRRGIRSLLGEVQAITVVGVASSMSEALDLVRTRRPNVVLLDAGLTADSSFAATSAIVNDPTSNARVIMLSNSPDVEHALGAFAAGVSGYVSRDLCLDEMLAAIDRARRGETSVDPILGARLLLAVSRGPVWPANRPEPLTARESDVIRLLAEGKTNKEIAGGLALALGTVKVHVERIFAKLGASTRSEAAVRAIEFGLVDPPGTLAGRPDSLRESLDS